MLVEYLRHVCCVSFAIPYPKGFPKMPAICDNCQKVFATIIEMKPGGNASFIGNTAGPCPKCGGIGYIPDSTYSGGDEFINLIFAPSSTIQTLRRLGLLLQDARDNNLGKEEVAQAIEQELPEYSRIAQVFRTTNLFVPFMTIVIMFIFGILQLMNDGSGDTYINEVNINVEQTLEFCFNSIFNDESVTISDISLPENDATNGHVSRSPDNEPK